MTLKTAKRLSLFKWNKILEYLNNNDFIGYSTPSQIHRHIMHKYPSIRKLVAGCGLCELYWNPSTAPFKCADCPLDKMDKNCYTFKSPYAKFINSTTKRSTIEACKNMIAVLNKIKA